jgi:hypothetical protein
MGYQADASLGSSSQLNLTASAVVKTGPGVVGTVGLISAPTTSGGIYDAATIGTATAANQICAFPITGTAVLNLRFPVRTGITVLLTGGSPVVALSYT